jgi:rhomboid protease GluP
MSSSLPSGQNRSQELFSTIPFITKGLLLFNVSIFILMFLFSIDPGYFAISAFQVLYLYEFYRIFSSAFVHMSILHIGMNMLSLFQLGSSLEKQFGSLQYFFLTLGSVFTAGFIYILLSW